MITYDNIPARVAKLPRDHRGFPVPWFVATIDGKPDFRVIDHGKFPDAIKHRKCWICGEQLGKHLAFVIGPMCAINRISSEPPSHRDCAEFAAKACPFLTQPKMRRNEKNLPEVSAEIAGIHLPRNPGVTLIWMTNSYSLIKVDNGVLIQVGDPNDTMWFAEGRAATRAEVMASIDGGLPYLTNMAKQDGLEAMQLLGQMYAAALQLLPQEAAA